MDNNFDDGFDLEFPSFINDEDFGLAKSFSTAPMCLITPSISLKS
jgi:hypothetical protein